MTRVSQCILAWDRYRPDTYAPAEGKNETQKHPTPTTTYTGMITAKISTALVVTSVHIFSLPVLRTSPILPNFRPWLRRLATLMATNKLAPLNCLSGMCPFRYVVKLLLYFIKYKHPMIFLFMIS